MGLFGLFASIVGLGAMAKDGIDRSFLECDKRNEAISLEKNLYYTGNGAKMKSTKTGRPCYMANFGPDRHWWLIDLDTDEKIEDLTLKEQKAKTKLNRKKAEDSGEKFYLDCTTGAYINDDLPGKYYDVYRDLKEMERRFTEVTLEDDPHPINGRKKKHPLYNTQSYYIDGTPYSREEMIHRENDARRKAALKAGRMLYDYKIADMITFKKFAEWDVFAIYNKEDNYWTVADLYEEKTQVPHYKDKYDYRYWLEEVPGCKRFNNDGSEWIP